MAQDEEMRAWKLYTGEWQAKMAKYHAEFPCLMQPEFPVGIVKHCFGLEIAAEIISAGAPMPSISGHEEAWHAFWAEIDGLVNVFTYVVTPNVRNNVIASLS